MYGTVEGFEPVQPDEAPSNPTPYTDAPIGGETASELTADSRVEFDGTEYQFMERYGLGARAGDVVTVSAATDRDERLGVVVSEGDGANMLDGNVGASGAEVEVKIPSDGGCNVPVYNPDRLEGGEYSVLRRSVVVEGSRPVESLDPSLL